MASLDAARISHFGDRSVTGWWCPAHRAAKLGGPRPGTDTCPVYAALPVIDSEIFARVPAGCARDHPPRQSGVARDCFS